MNDAVGLCRRLLSELPTLNRTSYLSRDSICYVFASELRYSIGSPITMQHQLPTHFGDRVDSEIIGCVTLHVFAALRQEFMHLLGNSSVR